MHLNFIQYGVVASEGNRVRMWKGNMVIFTMSTMEGNRHSGLQNRSCHGWFIFDNSTPIIDLKNSLPGKNLIEQVHRCLELIEDRGCHLP